MCQPRGQPLAAESSSVLKSELGVSSACLEESPISHYLAVHTPDLRSISGPVFQTGYLLQTSLLRLPAVSCFKRPPISLSWRQFLWLQLLQDLYCPAFYWDPSNPFFQPARSERGLLLLILKLTSCLCHFSTSSLSSFNVQVLANHTDQRLQAGCDLRPSLHP